MKLLAVNVEHPDRLLEWLRANGCTDQVPVSSPVYVHGGVITYEAVVVRNGVPLIGLEGPLTVPGMIEQTAPLELLW